MSEPKSSEPKIIVDTDWKEQVAKEKEAAAKSVSSASEPAGEPDGEINAEPASESAQVRGPKSHDGQDEMPPPPQASFEMVVSMYFTQAMAMLGQIPNPSTGQPEINKPYAKHYIDTLDLLGEKTKGNLSDVESKMLSEALHALRMMYVNVKQPS